ncbi:cell division protein FtsX [Liberibacter crescens]|nr:cell division protein FtsX [Liberibacter crescens]
MIPSATIQGDSLMVVIAIMSFLACLTLGIVSILHSTTARWKGQILNEVTVQINPEEKVDMDVILKRVRDIVLSVAGIKNARIISEDETKKLLEPWLGSNIDTAQLPIPRLVVISINPNSPPDFQVMRTLLKETAPQAILDDHRTWINRLISMSRTTISIGIGIVFLVFIAMILTVIFATRSALLSNRHIVEVLHFIGAETIFIANAFQRHFLKISIKGAMSGGILASMAFLLANYWYKRSITTAQTDQAAILFGSFSLEANGYIGIFITMIIIASLTTLTARFTVINTIWDIDTIRSDPSRMDNIENI